MVPMIQHRNGHLGKTPQQWLHKDVFRRIRALSLAKHAKPSSRWNRLSIRRSCWTDKVSDLWVAPDMKASTG